MNTRAGWLNRRVLVTGGAGFLGSNLCRTLASLGAHVTVIDSFLFGGGANLANLKGVAVELVRADILEADLRVICEGVEVIFNLAAQTSHMGGQSDPLADLAVNATAQLRLINAAREAAPQALVVHASTRQFYGKPKYLPVDEDHPIAPPDSNGISKFAGEQFWMLENRILQRPVVSLRLTNCYGPGLRIRDARQNFLGLWIRRVLEGEPFELWGGDQLRDLAYVDDVVEAFLLAAEKPACHGEVFNVGGGATASLKTIADTLVRLHGPSASYIVRDFPADRARIDIGSFHSQDLAFKRSTGWMPTVTLEDGLKRSLAWYERNLRAYV